MTKKTSKGFTLLEMLIVLLIVSSIFFIMSFNYFKVSTENKLQTEAKTLGEAYEVMQLKSLTENKDSQIIITDEGFDCMVDNDIIYNHEFFDHLEIETNFHNNIINMTDDGKVSKGGTVTMEKNGQKVSVIIDISYGRYRIEK